MSIERGKASSLAIEINHLGVTYPNGHSALENVNFRTGTGRICGLVGVNGAGKSTLFKSIMGFVTPTSGTIRIQGGDVKSALKRNVVAYVPQTEDVDWHFPVLVEDVVMMGRYGYMGFMRRPKAADETAVTEALTRVNMLAYRHRQIGELSGGQRKRVFVARALAQGGEIILLDEPFTGVDIQTEAALIDLFTGLAAEGRLIIVSTHNLGSIPRFCDDVALINRTVIAYGAVEDTFTEENLAKTFGGMLRHLQLGGQALHDDADARGITVLTDDEHPLVLYGEKGGEKIVRETESK
jgi:manganese/iron transport system ATP-binding protein